ncbi:site-specific DNA-methyltransferase [bacterium]|nr:site-specific DNA-methyltransferase [bacterium]
MELVHPRRVERVRVGPRQEIVLADAFEWLASLEENSLHAVVTDPPYGWKEYEPAELAKRRQGRGGIWRIPPAIGGCVRAPLPRFTALNPRERERLASFFARLGPLLVRALRPGGHVFLASNATLSQIAFPALARSGLEWRCEVVRLVRTLRGGNRPKNAHERFPFVSSTPRGGYEPWGLFRKPLDGTLEANLDRWQTGGLRRSADGSPFVDVIPSERTPRRERTIAPHPSLKPQSFLRRIVRAALPLGEGVVADPFMGSGSTIAAAVALGYEAVGVERDGSFFEMSRRAIHVLSRLS